MNHNSPSLEIIENKHISWTYSWGKILRFLCWLFVSSRPFAADTGVSYQHWMRHIGGFWCKRGRNLMCFDWPARQGGFQMLSFSSLKRSSRAPTNLNDIVSFFFRIFLFFFAYVWLPLPWCEERQNQRVSWRSSSRIITSLYQILKERNFFSNKSMDYCATIFNEIGFLCVSLSLNCLHPWELTTYVLLSTILKSNTQQQPHNNTILVVSCN